MSLFDSNYLTITDIQGHNLLAGRWMRSVMPFELHRGYNALLNIAAERHCRYWMVDIRRRSSLDALDVHWMHEEFYPQLYPRLGRTTFIAFLMAPHQLAGVMATAPPLAPGSSPEDQPYVLQRFTEERPALEWLQQHQQLESVTR
ncbi:hypothetical protein HMJ29_14750 [Hymenobacter taeanensis]|uniref:STAS/SEC14 domain-containing protein n=1 Tax=Hymenobacter taeanensis TaxID=2735321 RepID=A0A6M6BHR0_9BACT|nr:MULTISPECIES: hypothetical protein [Hymenobacter]QJX48121.1 hypothetical protein HMJ29_14750 [Hymenobacter taeanensis]UOQ82412.1 hypothetical protein MUN83_06500 [Hymenobacter sp. 5414T-23]